ncbi:DNA repair-scaffolding protein-like [Mya arenaria]|uniref:DNA repair-scaffolding protein-like n=1 Tax=Mya arenaria TaxID=6604 RepID=UPI0022E48EB8|nr:DNA repair-scaffolding protein-like [Mya arenaria]
MMSLFSSFGDRGKQDWANCGEGFSDMIEDREPARKTGKKRKSREPASSMHGNIFEKLGLGEQSGGSIQWSSSEEEGKATEAPPAAPASVSKRLRATEAPVNKRPRHASTSASRPHRQTKALSNSAKKTSVGKDSFKADTLSKETMCCDSVASREAEIAGFDSDDDNRLVVDLPEEEAESQPSISSVGSPEKPGTSSRRTASDWLQSIQLTTPTKTADQSQTEAPDDSAKKKKKQNKSGLAGQLARIQQRERSAVRMWSHQRGKPSPSQDSRSVTMEVLGLETVCSLQLARCRPALPVPSSENTPSSQLVLFPDPQAQQLSLSVGARLKIYPPWQQLELGRSQQVLLCTRYCQLLTPEDPAPPPGANTDTPALLSVAADQSDTHTSTTTTQYTAPVKLTWNCPCVQGLCRNMSLCPASQFPTAPGLIQEPSSSKSSSNNPQGKDTNSNVLKSTSHLHTVSTRGSNSTVDCSSGKTVCDSILESIQGRSLEEEDSSSPVLPFRAHVHRCVIQKTENGKKRVCMFVEDPVGLVCQVLLSGEGVVVDEIGGHTAEFSGLIVQDRLTRDRSEAVFSMVDSLWSGKRKAVSQDSASSQVESGEGQGFCYVVSDSEESPGKVSPCPKPLLKSIPLTFTPLASLPGALQSGQRRNTQARLLYLHTQDTAKCGYTMYVWDGSIKAPQGYTRVKASPGLYFPNWLTAASGSTCVSLLDLTQQDGMYLDEYSSVRELKQPPRALKSLSSVRLPAFQTSMSAGDLCTVQGTIVEVDEESAYSWEVCVHCGSDQLNTHLGEIQCTACKGMMAEGITRMKMEVIVSCSPSEATVRLNLLQSTIESLLPADEEDDEGYELSSVLHRALGPLPCHVTSQSPSPALLSQIEPLS